MLDELPNQPLITFPRSIAQKMVKQIKKSSIKSCYDQHQTLELVRLGWLVQKVTVSPSVKQILKGTSY